MTRLARTIENPLTRDRLTFMRTAADSGGEYVQVRVELEPGGGVPMHYHTSFVEVFHVLEGQLAVRVGQDKLLLEVGDRAKVPVRQPHCFYNASAHPVIFEAEARPARSFEKALRVAYGLARDGRCNARGIPRNVWELALVFEYSESYLPGLPLWMQQSVFGFLARIARARGVEQRLAAYHTVELPVSG